MLSALPDVVLAHVHSRLGGVERAQRRVTPEAPEASARHEGDAINVIERREGDGENLLERDCLLSSSLFPTRRGRELKDERKHVGDGLNKRGTRRFPRNSARLTRTRDETRAQIPRSSPRFARLREKSVQLANDRSASLVF